MKKPLVVIRYGANGLTGLVSLPYDFFRLLDRKEIAELAAADHWREHPGDTPTYVTVVHLQDVESEDMGLFEVRCDMRPIFTASQLRQA